MKSIAIGTKGRIFCNRCLRKTWHEVKCSEFNELHDTDPDDDPWYETERIDFMMCCGCGAGAIRHLYDQPDYDEPTVTLIPERRDKHHAAKTFRKLPPALQLIYREAVRALNGGLTILCAAGLRTLIEGICDDKGIKGRSLEKKIDNLVGLLPKNIVVNLHSFRFMGNDALHELKPPSVQQLNQALDLSEDLLNFLYDLDYKAQAVLAGVARRPASHSKGTPPAADATK